MPHQPISTLFPYTTLFRSLGVPALRDVTLDGLDAALARLDDDVTRRRVRHIVTENQRVLDTVELLRTGRTRPRRRRSEEHTSELQSQFHLVCRLLLEKKKK